MSMFVKMVYFECWVCGIPFGMSKDSETRLRANGGDFKCISGCGLKFGEGRINELERKLAEKQREVERAEREAKRYKCPHCPKTYATRQKVLSHVRLTHEAPLKLPKDAGPDALNSKVN